MNPNVRNVLVALLAGILIGSALALLSWWCRQ